MSYMINKNIKHFIVIMSLSRKSNDYNKEQILETKL